MSQTRHCKVPDAPGWWVRWSRYGTQPQQIERFVIGEKGIEFGRIPGHVYDGDDNSIWEGPLIMPDFPEQPNADVNGNPVHG